jgi:hypothetical protein
MGMVIMTNRILKGSSPRNTFTGLLLSCLVLTTAFWITPDLPQSLYWGQGMRSLILPLIPLFFQLVIIFSMDDHTKMRSQRVWWIVLAVLSFIAGGFGETYVVIQTVIFGLLVAIEVFKKPYGFRKRKLIPLSISLVFSLLSMVVTILAPGNRVRQTYFPPPPGLVDLFAIAYRSMSTFFYDLTQSSTYMVGLGFLIVVSILTGCLYAIPRFYPQSTISGEKPSRVYDPGAIFFVVLTASFIVLLYACFLPSAYGMSTMPPDRTLILPSLVLCAAVTILAFAAGLKIGILPLLNRSPHILSSGWVSLLAVLILAGVSFQVSSHVLQLAPNYSFFAARFDRADQMIREAKARGDTSVAVPEVHNHFGLSDYGEGTTYWLDNAVDSYYGLHVIINKNMK